MHENGNEEKKLNEGKKSNKEKSPNKIPTLLPLNLPESTLPQPLYIAFEGNDASGKSTIAAMVADRLAALFRIRVRVVSEPSKFSTAGRYLHSMVLNPSATSESEHIYHCPVALFELFSRDRKELQEQVVKPMLQKNTWIVQDRTFISTVVYQGQKGVDRDMIWRRAISDGVLLPDVLVGLTLHPSAAKERLLKRLEEEGKERNNDLLSKFEKHYESSLGYHEEYVKLFTNILPNFPGIRRVVSYDTSSITPDYLADKIVREIIPLVKENTEKPTLLF